MHAPLVLLSLIAPSAVHCALEVPKWYVYPLPQQLRRCEVENPKIQEAWSWEAVVEARLVEAGRVVQSIHEADFFYVPACLSMHIFSSPSEAMKEWAAELIDFMRSEGAWWDKARPRHVLSMSTCDDRIARTKYAHYPDLWSDAVTRLCPGESDVLAIRLDASEGEKRRMTQIRAQERERLAAEGKTEL